MFTLLDYAWMLGSAVVGIGLDVSQKIGKIQKENKDFSAGNVFHFWWKYDWNTIHTNLWVLASSAVLLRVAMRLLAIGQYTSTIIFILQWIEVIYVIIGYAGQRIIYNKLGTAEELANEFFSKKRVTNQAAIDKQEKIDNE